MITLQPQHLPYPNFTTNSSRNASTVLDVVELQAWASGVVSSENHNAGVIGQLAMLISAQNDFIEFMCKRDPTLGEDYAHYKAVCRKTAG